MRAATSDTRIAPDPFSIVLPALCALAAISSIAAVHWSGEDPTQGRARSKRKVTATLRDLENCCVGLQELFRRLHKSPKLFAGEGAAAGAPIKFGVHAPRISAADVRLFRQSADEIASMLVLASQNAFDVMGAIEDGELEVPEDIFFGFGEVQETLNRVLHERPSLKDAVDIGTRAAIDLTQLVQKLKARRASGA